MLKVITEQAYRLFASYNPTRPLDICTDCCMLPQDEARLAAMQVNQIPKELLAIYNDGAKPEKTRIEEVKHFLPRYLELIGQFDFPSHSIELSLSRLIPFNPNEWSKDEFDLLQTFQMEYFKRCLSVYPLPSFNTNLDNILILFWKAGFHINDLLIHWQNDTSKESALHFSDVYLRGFEPYNPLMLMSAFGDAELANVLRQWLDSQKVKQHFAAAIESLILEQNNLSTAQANELSALYDILRIAQPKP